MPPRKIPFTSILHKIRMGSHCSPHWLMKVILAISISIPLNNWIPMIRSEALSMWAATQKAGDYTVNSMPMIFLIWTRPRQMPWGHYPLWTMPSAQAWICPYTAWAGTRHNASVTLPPSESPIPHRSTSSTCSFWKSQATIWNITLVTWRSAN